MSDPKGTPAAESPTRAFALKLDDWMAEALKADLAPTTPEEGTGGEAKAEVGAPADGEAQKPAEPPKP